MQKFTHVEDYIEIIGGYRDPMTNKAANHSALWFVFTPLISLARYDVSVFDSMCSAAIDGRALTERQAELAVKMILKYSRQLAQKNVDVSPLAENPQWRVPLRKMDYSKRLLVQDDKIMVMFPFKTELIEGLREFRKDSQGHGEWNKEKKRWEFALTEYNLEYLKTWAESQQFEIDPSIEQLHQLIMQVEQDGYAIELDAVDGQLVIKNASQSLIEYINTHCGGFDFDNLSRLMDLAPILGYTVDPSIQLAWSKEHGKVVSDLTASRDLKVDVTKHTMHDVLASVVKYAEIANRYPIVFFEPDTSNKMLNELWGIVGRQNIHMQRGKHKTENIPEGVKYIHITTPIKDMDIPLLVSTAGMMFGGDKSLMTQNAQKAIYFAADVYTSKKEYKVPDFEGEISNT